MSPSPTAQLCRRTLRCFQSIIIAICLSVAVTFAQDFCQKRLSGCRVSLPSWKAGRTAASLNMDSYERQIFKHVVRASDISERMSEIGGLARIKQDIRANVLVPLQYPHIFFGDDIRLVPSRGILFHGPPGTGKTMLARAIAAEASVPFLSLSLSSLENKYYGESSHLVAATFTLARKMQPVIVFFDELDGMLRTRSDADQSCVYGFKTELLTHMDGIHTKKNDAIVVIACTNTLSKLDPAVLRRLPRSYKIDLPSQLEREEILRMRVGTDLSEVELKAISACTHNYSGSDLSELCRRTMASHMQTLYTDPLFLNHLERATQPKDVACRITKVAGCEYMQEARCMTQNMREAAPATPRLGACPDTRGGDAAMRCSAAGRGGSGGDTTPRGSDGDESDGSDEEELPQQFTSGAGAAR